MLRHVFAAACAASAALAAPASAHALLTATLPRAGSTIPNAPAEVILTFTEAIEPDVSTIEVKNKKGASMATGPAHTPGGVGQELAVPIQNLPPGSYTVTWRVTSADAHHAHGKFRFTVRP